MGAEKVTWVPCTSNKCSEPLSHLSGPLSPLSFSLSPLRDRVLQYRLDWAWTHRYLLASASWELGLKVCATKPQSVRYIKSKKFNCHSFLFYTFYWCHHVYTHGVWSLFETLCTLCQLQTQDLLSQLPRSTWPSQVYYCQWPLNYCQWPLNRVNVSRLF